MVHWMLAFLPEKRPTLSSIRGHAWMKRRNQRKDNSKTWSRRRASRRSAPIAQKLDEITTSSSDSTVQDLKYERLLEKVSEVSVSVKEVVGEETKNHSFWNSLLEKVKLKKAPSFHFLPSAIFSVRNKVTAVSKSSWEDQLKNVLRDILKSQTTRNNAGMVRVKRLLGSKLYTGL